MQPSSTAAPDNLVPLTAGQRFRLVTLIAPCVVLAVMVLLFQAFWVPIVGPPQPLFYLLMAVALAFTGHEALQAFGDLRSGTAIATEDTIRSTWIGRSPGYLRAHATLERLGRVRLTDRARRDVRTGLRHRLVFSPASKVIWSAEPLGGLEDLGL